jgi:hypothetical protein
MHAFVLNSTHGVARFKYPAVDNDVTRSDATVFTIFGNAWGFDKALWRDLPPSVDAM